MDRALDDRIAERQHRDRGPPPRRARPTYPRDGVRKSTRDDRANLENDWVHDRYDDEPSPNRGSGQGRGRSRRDDYADNRRSPEQDVRTPLPAKLRVDNLHYELTEDDLFDLFSRIAPVKDSRLTYDRAGRSEGVAFVTYEHVADARTAIKEFDGANAKGQPIRITLLPPPARAGRKDNPFDRVQNPRSLFDRVEAPASHSRRGRSDSPSDNTAPDYGRNSSRRGPRGAAGGDRGMGGDRRMNNGRGPPENIDRYVPGQNGRSTSRRDGGSTNGGGRRPGERRERRPENSATGGAPRSGARPKKTAEELDAEMEDYWNSTNQTSGTGGETTSSHVNAGSNGDTTTRHAQQHASGLADDIDMIE